MADVDFTQDELRAEAVRRGLIPADNNAAPMEPSDGGLLAHGDTTNSFGFMSHPIANTMKGVHAAQDFAGGLMGGAQRFGAFLSEPVEMATHAAYEKLTGNKVPHYNVRELWGLEGDNPVDLNKSISNNPDSFMSKIGQYAPAIAAGGTNLARQAITNGLWGAVQANPNQENLGGILPSGRVGAGIENAGEAALLGGAAKYAPGMVVKGAQQIGKAVDYLRPDKDAAAFLQSLGGGTREANTQQLAQMIQDAHQGRVQEALSHKTPIYQQEAKLNLYQTPESALPEGNLDKMAYYVTNGEKVAPEQLDALSKEIQNYRKGYTYEGKEKVPYTIEDFNDEVGNIFKTELNPLQEANLEHAMSVPTTQPNSFGQLAAKNEKYIQGNTKDLYDKFLKKPTLENADALQSQLGDDWGYYDNLRKQGKLEPALKPTMQKLKELRDSLKDDMLGALNRKNPAYGEEIAKYNKKWAENVVPYGEENFTQNIVGEGRKVREARAQNPEIPFSVTPEEANSYFANPTWDALKVSNDIGEEGQKRILYNLLAGDATPEAKGLANAIIKAKQSQGYSRYITPEMEDLATQLLKRTKWRGRAAWGTKGLAGAIGAATAYEAAKKLI